jgi:hypothetical protein
MVFLADSNKFQAQTAAWLHMANNGLRINFTLLNQKVKFRFCAGRELTGRFNEETPRA